MEAEAEDEVEDEVDEVDQGHSGQPDGKSGERMVTLPAAALQVLETKRSVAAFVQQLRLSRWDRELSGAILLHHHERLGEACKAKQRRVKAMLKRRRVHDARHR